MSLVWLSEEGQGEGYSSSTQIMVIGGGFPFRHSPLRQMPLNHGSPSSWPLTILVALHSTMTPMNRILTNCTDSWTGASRSPKTSTPTLTVCRRKSLPWRNCTTSSTNGSDPVSNHFKKAQLLRTRLSATNS